MTKQGRIWTSYFDEGVFGNNGWRHPIGASGLIAWDSDGHQLYYNQDAGITDCYALNVINEDEVWFYYYTDFKLVRLTHVRTQPRTTYIEPGISGSSGFCTDGEYFLFDSGYGKRDTCILKKHFPPGRLTKGKEVSFLNEHSELIANAMKSFRQNQVLLYKGNKLYLIAIQEVAAILEDLRLQPFRKYKKV